VPLFFTCLRSQHGKFICCTIICAVRRNLGKAHDDTCADAPLGGVFVNVRARAVVVFHMFAVATWQIYRGSCGNSCVFKSLSCFDVFPKGLSGVKCTLPSRTVKMSSFGREEKVIYSGLRLRSGVLFTGY